MAGHTVVRALWGDTLGHGLGSRGLARAVRLAAGWLTGTLLLSWVSYLGGYLAYATVEPLLWGNLAAGAVGVGLWFIGLYQVSPPAADSSTEVRKLGRAMLVPLGVTALFAWLCFWAFNVTDEGLVRAGPSVFSDYGPHLAVIRSFSEGLNFPTQYPHFPDGNARYHFMFQFLCGNMEWLGLPLDWAFNLPSILAFGCAMVLLFALTVRITGSGLAGALAVLFFFFRGGLAAWHFLREIPALPEMVRRAWANDQFIGLTRHEDWGLWNQNVYLNQRHLCLGLAMLFLAILLLYPNFDYMARRLREPGLRLWARMRNFFFSREAWLPEGRAGLVGRGVGAGLLIGACGFWNGAAVIAALLILFVFSFLSARRLEFLTLAVVAAVLCFLQNRLFIGPDSLAVAPEWVFGFLADQPTKPASVARYLVELLGILPFVVIGGLAWTWLQGRHQERTREGMRAAGRLALAFIAPLVLAFTLKLTPDIAINHKYVMISVMLLNILVAGWVSLLLKAHRLLRVCASLLIVGLTLTGWIDLRTIVNKDRPDRALIANLNEPVLKWVLANTDRRDRILTDWISYHAVLLAGRPIYYGWPYYAWGAGYDTRAREEVVKRIYGGTNPDDIREAVSEARVQYIMIDDGNREQKLYTLQEKLLTEMFPVVFRHRDVVLLKTNFPTQAP